MSLRIEEYSHYDPLEILPLYESVDWVNYVKNPQILENAYRNSLKIYAAYSGSRLVGIIRVVGDGFSVVFVQDLLVSPDCQLRGIGSALLKKVLEEYPQVYQMHLLTDNTEKNASFYRSLGFVRDADIHCSAFSRYYIL